MSYDRDYHLVGMVNGLISITKTRLFKYILPPKMAIFQIKNSDIFHISAQNIDCGYSLKPPHRRGFNEYPQSMFYYIKVGFKGVKII